MLLAPFSDPILPLVYRSSFMVTSRASSSKVFLHSPLKAHCCAGRWGNPIPWSSFFWQPSLVTVDHHSLAWDNDHSPEVHMFENPASNYLHHFSRRGFFSGSKLCRGVTESWQTRLSGWRRMLTHECVCALSRVWLFAALWTVAHQASLSMGFSRQEHWSGLPFPSPGYLPDSGVEPGSLVSPALGRWILYH